MQKMGREQNHNVRCISSFGIQKTNKQKTVNTVLLNKVDKHDKVTTPNYIL